MHALITQSRTAGALDCHVCSTLVGRSFATQKTHPGRPSVRKFPHNFEYTRVRKKKRRVRQTHALSIRDHKKEIGFHDLRSAHEEGA